MRTTKKWGTPLWMFFHIISLKIHEEYFIKNKHFIIHHLINEMINKIPCEYCRGDAVNVYKHNKHKIQSKEQFINFFYEFHNHVNKKTNTKLPSKDILEQYKKYTIFDALKYLNTYLIYTDNSNLLYKSQKYKYKSYLVSYFNSNYRNYL